MSATLVVDASVVVDIVAPERTSDSLERLTDALGYPHPVTLIAPDLIFLEVANALRKLAVNRHIAPAGADRVMEAFEMLPIASVPCGALLRPSWELRSGLSAYDAAYVALARSLELPLVTMDRRAATAARRARVRAWHPDDAGLHGLLDALRSEM